MLRILFDELGDAHSDIFLKIDAMPTFLQVADTYYLGDFLGSDSETKKEDVLNYLTYFKTKILELTEQESFIAFDLSDEYIGGLFMRKSKKGIIKTQYGISEKLQGWRVGQGNIDELVNQVRPDFSIDSEWLLSADSVLYGLDWSLAKING
ncbi:MAG: hypothetical protein EP332_14225 [Bacteroidetes bacterium]|nr:MAG: hypothetical protein EP332_14225 [Bacteroidota bacterium]